MLAKIATLHPQLPTLVSAEELRRQKDKQAVADTWVTLVGSFYAKKCTVYPPEIVQRAEQIITLQAIDAHWMDHIDTMAHLREQVAFSGYAQRDPLIEYQDQGFRLFQKLLVNIETTIVRSLLQADFNQFGPQKVQMDTETGCLISTS